MPKPVLVVALVLAWPAAARGQVEYGTDLTWATSYRWRGLPRHEGHVFQGAAFVSMSASPGDATRLSATTGAWASLALARPDSTRSYGAPAGVTETNGWLELAFASRPLDAALGATAYLGRERRTPPPVGPPDEREWYLRVESLDLPLFVPRVLYVRGLDTDDTYLEAALLLRVPVWNRVAIPAGSLTVGAAMGLARGASGAPAAYARNGVTHWELSATAPIGWLPVTLPGVALDLAIVADYRLTRAVDPATARRPDGTLDIVRHRFALTLTLLGPRCRPTRAVCDPPR